MSHSNEPHVLTQDQGFIRIITLNRAQARNAYSITMIEELIDVLDQTELMTEIRCVILTGAGSAFSAGGDLKLMQNKQGMFAGEAQELRTRYMQSIHKVPRRLSRFSKPVIAAINGAAIGAGLDLSLMCDLRIAVERAKFGSTFVKLGLIPGDGGAYFLSRIVGVTRALELIMSARIFSAQEAYEYGMLNQVVTDDQLMPTALKLAQQISENAPLAVQMSKTILYQSLHQGVDQALHWAATAQGMVQNTADHMEGVEALLEKRPAQFTGK